jgi:AcrR family transcriptional regulator
MTRLARREQQKADTRDALIRAAAEVFAAKGYSGATIPDVAAAAGASRATVYLHFATKADLGRAVIEDLKARAADWAADLPTGARRRADVEVLVRAWIAFYRDNLDGFRVWHEFSVVEPALEPPVRAAGSAIVERLLGHAVPEATVRAEVTVAMTFLTFDRLLFGWLVQGWPVDEDAVVAEVTDAWHGWFLPRLRRQL